MNSQSNNLPLSVLDLVPVLAGKTVHDAFVNSLGLARHTEKLGYQRFWLAEHHNMPGIASSATSVLIGYIAGGTSTIRVGSGGVMLPNHAPLVIAEQFGTLANLYPGRIDLGLGRAPGTDQLTAMALRRHLDIGVDDFPQNVQELRRYISADNQHSKVRAVQAEGTEIPVWLLGSSSYSAQLAAILGLPFSFASHFAPSMLFSSLKLYRETFQPSDTLAAPHTMAVINVIAAETDEEARHLATSLYQAFLNVIKGKALPMQPPVDNMDDFWNESEKYAVTQMLTYTFIGSVATVEKQIRQFLEQTRVDELMVTTPVYDHQARLRSFEILAGLSLQKAR
ncbi:LLM class flavin-dependent oxidoreductase [Flavihumibacter sp. R14]|nr:LLM class flavin-dependent oxidoreductase [Flavihumibacter soli]